jgi:cytochrome c oxidase assembly protein subunit 15
MKPLPTNQPEQTLNPWPHRVAWALACTALALIWVGGLVSTYRAGMSVPDWPTTYGYWFYPLHRWLTAFWDLFLEHGHRMLGQAVGMLAIAATLIVWRWDRRKWIRWLALAVLAGVCIQGTLGGLRVRTDSLLLAKIHACNAPLCFALCATLVTLTSPAWQRRGQPREGVGSLFPPTIHRVEHALMEKDSRPLEMLKRLALFLTAALYGEIILGAQLRHQPLDPAPGWFELWVWLKLIGAGLIAAAMVWLLVDVRRQAGEEPMLVRRAKLLGTLFVAQLVLGAATWVTNFGWPLWFTGYLWAVEYTVVAQGRLQANVTTAHAAVASLTLAAALSLVLWSHRLLQPPAPVRKRA